MNKIQNNIRYGLKKRSAIELENVKCIGKKQYFTDSFIIKRKTW